MPHGKRALLLLLLVSTAHAGTVNRCVIAGKVEFRDYACDSVPMTPGVSSWEWRQGFSGDYTTLPEPAREPIVVPDPNAAWNAYVTERVRELRRPDVRYYDSYYYDRPLRPFRRWR